MLLLSVTEFYSNPTTTSASFGTQTETSEYSSNAGKLTETKSSLVLGANDSVTLPAGYYNKQVTISNGVINRTRNDKVTVSGLVGSKGEAAANGNITKTFADGDYDISALDNVNSYLYLGAKSAVTFPAGYYSKPITVENSVTDRSNTVLKVEANYDAASMSTSDKSKEGTAKKGQYSTATNGSNPSVNSNGKAVLGINETITLPAGYYENPLTVSNGVVNRGSVTKALNAGKSQTLAAGYYSGVTISANSLASQTAATSTAGDILSGKTAWVNGLLVTGNMPNHGAPSTVLTSRNKTVNFPAGYYDAFTVSTDYTSIPGTIEYHHHVHSLTSSTEEVRVEFYSAKGNNILLMTLTSLSASVTIIGGIIAFVRHLRGRGKKKNPVSKAQSSKNGKTPSNSMTAEPSVSSKKTPNEEKVLTETQQINMQADELLKNHKKQQKEYRRRRR